MSIFFLIINTILGSLLLADLVSVTNGEFTTLFIIQATVYLVNIVFVFIKTNNIKIKNTKALIRYIALLGVPINVIIELAYNELLLYIIIIIILTFIISIITNYFIEEDEMDSEFLDKKLDKYLGKYYVLLNLCSIVIAIIMIFWMMMTMVMWI